ncbi:MAG: TonB-dependent receptor domain-containing protein [Paludibacter sp.]
MKKTYIYKRAIAYFLFCIFLLVPQLLLAVDIQKNDSIISHTDSISHRIMGSCSLATRIIKTAPQGNPGLITSFDQMISGKFAGVQIMTNDGSLTSGSFIQLRGISSLINSSQPLIVIDGIPLETAYTSSNLANILNPDDIQEITVMKDAASNSIYGMRASGGVISITTKKGRSDKLRIDFSTTNAIQQVTRTAKVLSAEKFRNLINTQGSDAEKALAGNASTNWTHEIFQTVPATDNHLSISGGLAGNIPFRVSFGYLNEKGILKTDQADKLNGSLALNPSFFKNHLNLSLNFRGTKMNNQVANKNAIGAAAAINPTVPVTSNEFPYAEKFGGYWQTFMTYNNSIYPASLSISNPVALLYQTDDKLNSINYFTNVGLDYKLHFFEDLHFYINYGNYYSGLTEDKTIPVNSYQNFIHGFLLNRIQVMSIENLQVGFKYNKNFNKHNINASVNHESNSYRIFNGIISNGIDGYDKLYNKSNSTGFLVSYFGQIKYNYDEKYFITVNSRLDGSSRFSVANRWANAPGIGLAWNATNENFMKDQPLSNLVARINYGLSGQQPGSNNSTVYNANLKWETTKSLNYGIDFGLRNNRITGTIDFYNRTTGDLLKYVTIASGSNSNQTLLVNKGTLNSSGGELTINTIPVMTDKIVWSLSFTAAYQKAIISDYGSPGITYISFNGVNLITKDGYSPAMFYALKQKFDAAGKPIEGSYSDINADAIINDNDYYAYHSAVPDCLLGLNSILTYGKWSAGISFRASIGNYVYNQTNAQLGNYQQNANLGYLRNITTDYLNTGFKTPQSQSDYYVENASFLKMDYLNVGYDFGDIAKNVKLNLMATVQNVFTLTAYSGIDPEIPNGIDNGFYPRPRVYSISFNIQY